MFTGTTESGRPVVCVCTQYICAPGWKTPDCWRDAGSDQAKIDLVLPDSIPSMEWKDEAADHLLNMGVPRAMIGCVTVPAALSFGDNMLSFPMRRSTSKNHGPVLP